MRTEVQRDEDKRAAKRSKRRAEARREARYAEWAAGKRRKRVLRAHWLHIYRKLGRKMRELQREHGGGGTIPPYLRELLDDYTPPTPTRWRRSGGALRSAVEAPRWLHAYAVGSAAASGEG